MRFPVNLIVGLDKESKEAIISQYETSQKLLKSLSRILKKKLEQSYVNEEQIENLDLAKVADSLGYRRALREVLAYLPQVDTTNEKPDQDE